MALKKFVERLTKPVEDLDRENLRAWCEAAECSAIADVQPRVPARVAGEVRSVRIVPRAGADALEVVVDDGAGSIVGVFLGRRKIAGISPGRRIILQGVAMRHGNQLQIYNPIYVLR
ncbi:MAG: OB-fold nucleic acid binding domain-containing protein [Actinomycetota bacterium]